MSVYKQAGVWLAAVGQAALQRAAVAADDELSEATMPGLLGTTAL
jgi:hypothetical protein